MLNRAELRYSLAMAELALAQAEAQTIFEQGFHQMALREAERNNPDTIDKALEVLVKTLPQHVENAA